MAEVILGAMCREDQPQMQSIQQQCQELASAKDWPGLQFINTVVVAHGRELLTYAAV